jgi:two-component system sensor histidine kinase TctE
MLTLTPDAVTMLRTDSRDSIYYRISGGDGHFIAGDEALPVPHQGIRNPEFSDSAYRGEKIRMVSYRVNSRVGEAIVSVAETLHKRAAARATVLRSSLAVDAAQLAIALVVIWLGVRLAFAPLRELENQIAARRPGDLEPLTHSRAPLEIHSLIGALNRLLALLREAEQSERVFLENAAHQLRTPLAAMLAQLELLDADRAAPRSPNVQGALAAGRRLARTTQQLLALARSDAASRAAAEFEWVALPSVIESCVTSRLSAADGARVELGAQVEPAQVRGVRWLLEEALGNLADNAIAATPPGGSITLQCGMDGEQAWLEVLDTGVGIPREERNQVFERFYRGSNARAKGTGLGLAIVAEVAAIHHARLTLFDGPQGSGTRLRMTFALGET